jgi:hypothetical protein
MDGERRTRQPPVKLILINAPHYSERPHRRRSMISVSPYSIDSQVRSRKFLLKLANYLDNIFVGKSVLLVQVAQ